MNTSQATTEGEFQAEMNEHTIISNDSADMNENTTLLNDAEQKFMNMQCLLMVFSRNSRKRDAF